jgi:hypothetical protein
MKNDVSMKGIYNRVVFGAATFLFVASGIVGAQAEQTYNQIKNEHPDWVQIPGELIRPDCVHEVPNGAQIETDDAGQITGDVTLNGEFIAHYDPCSEDPIVTRPQGRTEGLANTPGTGNGWVEASQWEVSLGSSDNIDYLSGLWVVPSAPSVNGALIYLFNGIGPTDGNAILQPVLQYGVGRAGGGNYWAIASWLVGPGKFVFHSPLEKVHTGDLLFGYTKQTGISGSILDWTVSAKDDTTGAFSLITTHTSGLHWIWAFAGVLEAYNVTSCSEFPASDDVQFAFTNVDRGFPAYNPITPQNFFAAYYNYGGPSCGFNVTPGDPSTLKF